MKKYLILTHVSADFDAAASCYAASILFENSIPVLPGSPNKNVRDFISLHSDLFRFYSEKEVDLSEVEKIVLTDIQSIERTGYLKKRLSGLNLPVIIFDHHPLEKSSDFPAERIIEKTGSTTTILVEKLKEATRLLSPAEATFLALGIHEDTGSLTFKSTTERDARALAWLYELGAQPELIYRFLHSRFSETQTELLIELIKNSRHEKLQDKNILFSVAKTEAFVDGASSVVHRLVDIYNPDFALVILESLNRLTIIARSTSDEMDCLQVLSKYEPAGHPEAAVAYIDGTRPEQVIEETLEEIRKLLKPEIKVKDIMSRIVVSVKPHTKISEVIELFKKTGHSGFPVVEKGKLVGMVTRHEADKAVMHELSHAPVKGFMIRDVYTVHPETGLHEAVRLMMEKGIGRLPVLDSGKIVGIVTRTDILRALHGSSYYSRQQLEAKQLVVQRFKERIPFDVQQLLRLTGYIADELGYTAYLVGGIVRDLILGYDNPDYDIVIEGSAIEVAKRLVRSTGARIDAYRRFDTAVVIFKNGLRFDFATARTEYYEKPGSLPKVQKSGIKSDLLRRDFSINALAFSLSRKTFGNIVDVAGGLNDINNKTIRVLHSLSFIEDPTRIIRAIRFEARFGFSMDETTESLAREAVKMGVLKEATSVRMRDEIFDLFKEKEFLKGIERAHELGVFNSMFAPFSLTVKKRKMLENIKKAVELKKLPDVKKLAVLAVMLSDKHKDWIESFSREYKLNSSDRRILLETVEMLNLVGLTLSSNSEIYERFSKYREESLIAAFHSLSGRRRLKSYIGKYLKEIKNKKPPVSGKDLLELGYRESPLLGRVKNELFKLYLDGKLRNREEALEHAKSKLKESELAEGAE